MPDQTQGFTPGAANEARKQQKEAQHPMKSRLPQLNYANVIATMALFIALSGVAVAASLPKNSVGPKQLKRGAVNTAKLKRAAVTSGKLRAKAVTAGKLGPNAVLPGNLGNGVVTTAKIGNGAVIARSIKNNVVTTNKLNNNAVTTQKLANGSVTTANLANGAVNNRALENGSVTPNKLSNDFGPLYTNLKSGQTLRGSFAVGGAGKELTVAIDGQSFQVPLTNTPAINVINPSSAVSAACSGLGSGQTPAATAGNLCLYVTSATNLKALTVPPTSISRLGFGLEATPTVDTEAFSAYGQWAVTAP
jgi:hypothetical protein